MFNFGMRLNDFVAKVVKWNYVFWIHYYSRGKYCKRNIMSSNVDIIYPYIRNNRQQNSAHHSSPLYQTQVHSYWRINWFNNVYYRMLYSIFENARQISSSSKWIVVSMLCTQAFKEKYNQWTIREHSTPVPTLNCFGFLTAHVIRVISQSQNCNQSRWKPKGVTCKALQCTNSLSLNLSRSYNSWLPSEIDLNHRYYIKNTLNGCLECRSVLKWYELKIFDNEAGQVLTVTMIVISYDRRKKTISTGGADKSGLTAISKTQLEIKQSERIMCYWKNEAPVEMVANGNNNNVLQPVNQLLANKWSVPLNCIAENSVTEAQWKLIDWFA